MLTAIHEWEYNWEGKAAISSDLHPHQPWVALLFEDGRWEIFDFQQKRSVRTGNLTQARREANRRPGEKGNNKQAETTNEKDKEKKAEKQKKERLGHLLSIKFLDNDVAGQTAFVEANSSALRDPKRTFSPIFSKQLVLILTELHLLAFDLESAEVFHIDMMQQLEKSVTTSTQFSSIPLIALGCNDGSIVLWDINKWTKHTELKSQSTKQILKLISFTKKDQTFLHAFSTDEFHTLFNVTTLTTVTTFRLLLSAVAIIGIHPTSGDLFCIDKEITFLNVLTARITKKVPNNQLHDSVHGVMHDSLPPGSLVACSQGLLSLLDETNPSKSYPFINPDSGKVQTTKCLKFQQHPKNPEQFLIQIPTGIQLVSLIERHFKRFWDFNGSIITTSGNSLVSLPRNQLETESKTLLDLGKGGPIYLLGSPSNKFLIAFWRIDNFCKIINTESWKIIESFQAQSIGWCSYDDLFVIIAPFNVVKQPEQLQKSDSKKAKKGRRGSMKKTNKEIESEKMQKVTVYGKLTMTVYRAHPSEAPEPITFRSFSGLVLVPHQVWGGTLVGFSYTAVASQILDSISSKKKRAPRRVIRFFSWTSLTPVHSPVLAPLDVVWDPNHQFCALLFPDFIRILNVETFISEPIIVTTPKSAIWFNNTLICLTNSQVFFYFPKAPYKEQYQFMALENLQHALIQHPFVHASRGITHLISVTKGDILSIGYQQTKPIEITAEAKFYLLAQAGLIEAAVPWTYANSGPSDECALFLASKGYLDAALDCNVSIYYKLGLCLYGNNYKRWIEHFRQIQPEMIKSNDNRSSVINQVIQFLNALFQEFFEEEESTAEIPGLLSATLLHLRALGLDDEPLFVLFLLSSYALDLSATEKKLLEPSEILIHRHKLDFSKEPTDSQIQEWNDQLKAAGFVPRLDKKTIPHEFYRHLLKPQNNNTCFDVSIIPQIENTRFTYHIVPDTNHIM